MPATTEMKRTKTKKSNVHSLWGAAPPVPEVVPSVVEKLEEMLAQAKEGRLIGFAFAWLSGTGHGQFGWVGTADRDRPGQERGP